MTLKLTIRFESAVHHASGFSLAAWLTRDSCGITTVCRA